MSKGMISNYTEADQHMIDIYDDFLCAKEFSTPLSEIETWSEEKMAWAKTVLRVINNMEGGK